MPRFGPFSIENRPDGVAIVWFGVEDRPVNVLRRDFAGHLDEVLDALESRESLAGVVLASRKEDGFIAGADITMLRDVKSAEEASAIVREGQAAVDRLAAFHPPVVAAIHGACLGGGLEVAMACGARVASDAPVTRLGQPEVQLGLVPGLGGTQRLPSLVGVEESLKLLLGGGRIPPERALEIGLVDEVVHPAVLVEAATAQARRLAEQGPRSWWDRVRARLPSDLRELLLEDNRAGRMVLYNQARKQIRSRSGDTMPAPFAVLECVEAGQRSSEAGFEAEIEQFGALAVSPQSRNLVWLFLAQQELGGSETTDDLADVPDVRRVGVVGAGLMGSGIALVTAKDAGLPVRLQDLDVDALRGGLKRLRAPLSRDVQRGRMDEREADRIEGRVTTTTDPAGVRGTDLVIEAVVEDLAIKHEVLASVEAGPRPPIVASNTSSIPIDRIADGARAPERVVGMHYFSPVHRVPLLEIVQGPRTAPEVVAAAFALGQRQGKTVVVVRDGPGFFTSRILAPYVDEANRWLAQGVPVERIDRALSSFGFPVGPLQLLDEVGLDVGAEIAQVLEEAFGERMASQPIARALVEDDRRGRKSGLGYYRYEDGERQGPDETLADRFDLPTAPETTDEAIAERCVLAMANEAARCLGDRIVRSARDADVAAVFGLGFPPFRGGLLRWLDERGRGRSVRDLEALEAELGPRFSPAPRLREHAERDQPLRP